MNSKTISALRGATVSAFLALVFCPEASTAALPAARGGAQNNNSALTRFEYSEVHMGTKMRIVLYAGDAKSAAQAARAAFARIAALDNIMSDYQDDSELMRLCRRAGGPPVRVSDDLFRVLAKAQETAEASQGAFDITVGPIVRLWRRARRQHELPDSEALALARDLVGYRNLRLDARAHTAELLKPRVLLDLGGIAKGDAADQALAVLRQHGCTSALVAAAGDIAAGDAPPGAQGWKIGIAPVDSPEAARERLIYLQNAAVSTSGDAEQHAVIRGARYSHIVDPETGWALTGQMSVTVVAPTGIVADSLATAVCVLGPERGLKLVDSIPGASALFVRKVGTTTQTFHSQRRPILPVTSPNAKASRAGRDD